MNKIIIYVIFFFLLSTPVLAVSLCESYALKPDSGFYCFSVCDCYAHLRPTNIILGSIVFLIIIIIAQLIYRNIKA